MTKFNWAGPPHNRQLGGSSAIPRQSVFAARFGGYCANCHVWFGPLTPITLRRKDRKPVHGYSCPAKEHSE